MNPQHFSVVEMQHNRAEYKYIHGGTEGISTAFEINEKAEICLNVPRLLGATALFLDVFDEDAHRFICTVEAEWQGIEGEYDKYIFNISDELFGVGLYFLRPRLLAFGNQLYGHKWAGSIYFDKKNDYDNMMQMTVCDFKHEEPTKIRGGVIYHIFVDRFNRGGKYEIPDGAKIIRGTWNVIPEYPEYPGAPLYNNTFYGGTLWGVINKLDYIKSLGTTAIYLSPIFRAASNHKYDTADYMTVDPIFGGEEALDALITEAKKRNIEIILDGVFNHTGCDSIYFNRYGRYPEIGAYQSKSSKYFSWYSFENHPTKYASWWGIEILPRINPDKPECERYFVGEGGVIEKYASKGIYGFRLDVADELSDAFISKIKSCLSKHAPASILYGEVWEDASNKSSYDTRRRYYQGAELDAVMNYPLRTGIIDYLTDKGYYSLAYAMTEVTANAPDRVLHNQMNLLGTHDTVRILTALGNQDVSGLNNHQLAKLRMEPGRRNYAINKLILAYTILATMPGIPTVFYGDEAGLEGHGDPFNRMPFPWGKESKRLVNHYTRIGQIRKENPVYINGNYKLLHIDNQLLAFLRSDGVDNYVTLVNNSDEEISVQLDSEGTNLLSGKSSNKFLLSSFGAAIIKCKINSDIEIY